MSGVEIAPLLWVISTLRARFAKSKAVFTLGSYQTIDFSKYDIDLISFEYIHMVDNLKQVLENLEICGYHHVGFGVDANLFDYLFRSLKYSLVIQLVVEVKLSKILVFIYEM